MDWKVNKKEKNEVCMGGKDMYYSDECLDCYWFNYETEDCNRPFFTCCNVEEEYYDELESLERKEGKE